jgi:acyl-homoserine lactone acylase PvdQ
MDPRERADRALARARARGAFVVTPDDAISPMDAASTLQIPRSVVAAADQAENTMIIPAGQIPGMAVYPPEPPPPPVEETPEPRQLDGLVPTVQQPGPRRSMLSRRLDGN